MDFGVWRARQARRHRTNRAWDEGGFAAGTRERGIPQRSVGNFFGPSRCALLPALFRAEIAADDSTAFHHKFDGLEDANIGERIAADRDQVSIAAGLE